MKGKYINFFFVVLLLTVVSCSTSTTEGELDNDYNFAKEKLDNQNNLILNLREARSIAENLDLKNPFGKKSSNKNGNFLRKLKKNNTISSEVIISENFFYNGEVARKSENETPKYYLFNYANNKGFSIVSADFRAIPILAYSDKGNIILSDSINIGLSTYLEEYYDYIGFVKDSVKYFTKDLANMWLDLGMEADNLPEIVDLCDVEPDYPCDNEPFFPTTSTWGPYLETEWGQSEGGFNNSAPVLGSCRALTGCVATAMAQVIRYWKHPSSDYNFKAMPAGNQSTYEIAKLMRDCGDAVSMDWGCYESSAKTNDAKIALENIFGYSSDAEYSSYSYSKLESNIKYGKPVILRACRENSFWSYNKCHAWVADGLRVTYYQTDTTYQVHMNWGWRGDDNGWYVTWTPKTRNYQYGKKILYNIHP